MIGDLLVRIRVGTGSTGVVISAYMRRPGINDKEHLMKDKKK